MATLVFTMLSAILTAVLAGPSSGQAYELLAPTVSCSNISQIPRSECLALEALYNSTDGPGWNVPSWSQRWFSTTTPCSWAGVTCSGAHVTTLGLDQLELDGTIPAQIGDLDYLRELYMNNNHLSGNIPRELGSLPSLQLLTTYNNNLSGSIPSELGNLGNLRHLDFSWNNLSGSIPAQIGNLANLQRLFLKGNNIGGHIPTSVANLAGLQIARFDNNNLVGDVPSVFGRLPNLLELGLQGNELTGPLPQTLVARSLTALDFRNTNICEPRDEAFQTWLNGIQYLGRTGVICPYQPNPFGYRFNNSRARTSWSIFRDTFGAENVEWNGAPNPLAASYYSTYFAAIEGSGVCSGMASSSALLYRGWASPTSFLVNQGAGATWELDGVINQGFLDYGDVANFIVRYQGYQLGKEISNANRNYSLSFSQTVQRIVDSIDGGLANPIEIDIRGLSRDRCNGHALIPYGYIYSGSHLIVSVYDSNHEGASDRRMSFDLNNETWSYNLRDTQNPLVWGSGRSCASIKALPISLWRTRPTPPWLSNFSRTDVSEMSDTFDDISVEGGGHLLITNNRGQSLGFLNGELVEEIPNAGLFVLNAFLPGTVTQVPERYHIDTTEIYTVTLAYSQTGTARINYFSPAAAVEIWSASTEDGVTDRINISPDSRSVRLSAGSAADGRSIGLLLQEETWANQVIVRDFGLGEEDSAVLEVGPTLQDSQMATFRSAYADEYDVRLVQKSATGVIADFWALDIGMEADDTHYILINWNNTSTAELQIDHESNGTIDETVTLQNQIKRVFLPFAVKEN